MKRLTTLLCLAALSIMPLSGCGESPRQTKGKDNYTFEMSQYEYYNFPIQIITYKTFNDLKESAEKYGVVLEGRDKLMAFSVLTANGTKCTMHIIDPHVKYMPEYIGHELTHCVYGQFHPTQN